MKFMETLLPSIITGLSGLFGAISGSLITGIIAYKIAKKNADLENAKRSLTYWLHQVESFRKLEGGYIKVVAKLENATEQTTQRKYRQTFCGDYSFTTPSAIQRAIDRFDSGALK